MTKQDGLAALFGTLRPRSKYSIEKAIETAQTDGLTGLMLVQIPAGADKPCECFFTNLPSDILGRLIGGG